MLLTDSTVEIVETFISAEGSFGFATVEAFETWAVSGEVGYLSSLTKLVFLRSKTDGEIISFL